MWLQQKMAWLENSIQHHENQVLGYKRGLPSGKHTKTIENHHF